MAASVPEVSVINVDYWAAHPLQLAVLLAGPASASVIPDPTGLSPDPNRMVAVIDPAYWASDPRTLGDALANLAAGRVAGGVQESVGRAAGAVGQTPDRLTMTVEVAPRGVRRALTRLRPRSIPRSSARAVLMKGRFHANPMRSMLGG